MSLRRKLQIACLVCLLADAGLVAWLVSPNAPSQAAAQQQLTLSRAQLAALRAESRQLQQLNTRLVTSRGQMKDLVAAGFPAQADASSQLLTVFSRIAGQANVQVSAAEFHPDTAVTQGLRKVTISLQVAGGYTGVVQFINQLERSPMFFIIDQVAVSGGAASASAANAAAHADLKLDLQLEAYEQAAGTS